MAARNNDSAVLLAWSKMVPISEVEDPLGLSLRVSARLSAELLHCITSVTPRARYFSFLPWCVADFAKREKDSQADADVRKAVRLREKALALGSVLNHDGGTCRDGSLIGSEGAQRWLIANPGKTPKLSSLFLVKDPALKVYRNSIVQMGFFEETPEDGEATVGEEDGDDSGEVDLELSELGKRVASAYEAAVGHLPVVAKLAKEPDRCKPGELKRLGELGGLCELAEASAPDRALLREVFFNRVGSPGPSHKFRRDSLTLLLELMEQTAPHGIGVDHRVLGDAVYFGATATGEDGSGVLEVRFSEQLRDIANRWRMFYFHYYLSLALEGLLVGVVGYAQRAGMTGTAVETIVGALKSKGVLKALGGALRKKVEGSFLEMTPNELLQAAGFGRLGDGFQAGSDFERHFNYSHPFSERNLADELTGEEMAYASPEGIAYGLLLVMMTVCRYTRWEGEQYGNWLAGAAKDPYEDVTVPVVVRRLRDSFGNFWDASWREIAMLVMGRFVVNQHEVLSYEKVWDGSRALFHSEEGVIRWRGLSYDNVAAGNPRFYSAVQILEDLALLEHEDSDWSQVSLTPEGVRFLKAELTRMGEK